MVNMDSVASAEVGRQTSPSPAGDKGEQGTPVLWASQMSGICLLGISISLFPNARATWAVVCKWNIYACFCTCFILLFVIVIVGEGEKQGFDSWQVLQRGSL